jgi:hypothetical protein
VPDREPRSAAAHLPLAPDDVIKDDELAILDETRETLARRGARRDVLRRVDGGLKIEQPSSPSTRMYCPKNVSILF